MTENYPLLAGARVGACDRLYQGLVLVTDCVGVSAGERLCQGSLPGRDGRPGRLLRALTVEDGRRGRRWTCRWEQ